MTHGLAFSSLAIARSSKCDKLSGLLLFGSRKQVPGRSVVRQGHRASVGLHVLSFWGSGSPLTSSTCFARPIDLAQKAYFPEHFMPPLTKVRATSISFRRWVFLT